MEHPARMGIGHRVADVEETPQQLAERSGMVASSRGVAAMNGVLEVVSLDEPHSIVRPAVRVAAQAVDRHDAGMFEPPGDLRFQEESTTAAGIRGVALLDLLQRHLSIQLRVEGNE